MIKSICVHTPRKSLSMSRLENRKTSKPKARTFRIISKPPGFILLSAVRLSLPFSECGRRFLFKESFRDFFEKHPCSPAALPAFSCRAFLPKRKNGRVPTALHGAYSACSDCSAGRRMVKTEPFPGALSTSTVPSCARTMPQTIESPSPVEFFSRTSLP